MHFQLERQPADGGSATISRRGSREILHDVRLVVRDFEPMQERVRHMIELARQARRPVLAAGGRRGGRLPRVAPAAELRAARATASTSCSTPSEGRAIRAVPGQRPRHPVRRLRVGVRRRDPARLAPRHPPADRGGRPARALEDERVLHRAPAGADGLHRGAAGGAGRGADRRGAADRAVHVEGVHGAGGEDAAAAPQARADPGRRGPDPRLARLQGGRRAVRVVPEGRALPGLDRGAAPAGRGAPAAREARRHPGARPQGPLRPAGLGRRGAPAREVQRRRCASACSRCSSSGSTGSRSTTTCRSGETESARIFFTVHVEPGVQIPEVPYEELEAEVERLARTWDDDLRDALDRASSGPERRTEARREVRGRGSPTTTRRRTPTGRSSSTTCSGSRSWSPPPRGSSSGSATRAAGERLTRVKLYKTGGKVDLSAFMPMLESLGLRVVEEIPIQLHRRGQESTSTTSACSTPAGRCSTSRPRPTASSTRIGGHVARRGRGRTR